MENENENLIFVKNKSTGLVKTIILNDVGNTLYLNLIYSKNLQDWLSHSSTILKVSKEMLLTFLKNLIKDDIITIIENSRENYVN
jgi:hypothetical protein